jgi:hypothetical protein
LRTTFRQARQYGSAAGDDRGGDPLRPRLLAIVPDHLRDLGFSAWLLLAWLIRMSSGPSENAKPRSAKRSSVIELTLISSVIDRAASVPLSVSVHPPEAVVDQISSSQACGEHQFVRDRIGIAVEGNHCPARPKQKA